MRSRFGGRAVTMKIVRSVLAAPFALLAFALVTVAMFSARAAMWISAGYRGAVKVEAEL